MKNLNLLLFLVCSVLLLSSYNKAITPPAYINVTDYGVTGDGFTDDTYSIINIFLNVVDTTINTTVFFPEGTYLIDPSYSKSMEIVGSNTTVDGVKGHTVIKLKYNSIDPKIPHEDSAFVVQRLLEGVLLGNRHRTNGNIIDHNITIRNIIFDGNCRGNPLQDDTSYIGVNNAVHFYSVKGLNVKNCEIINTCSAALVLVTCKNSKIQNNYIFDVGQGVRNADGIQVNGCINTLIERNILENTGEGIFCQHNNSTNTPDQDCKVENNIIRIVDYNGKCLGDQYPYSCCTGFMQGNSVDFECRRGKARGSSIGILSQDSSHVAFNSIFGHFPMTIHAQQRHANQATTKIEVHHNTFFEISKYNPSSGGAIWLIADSNVELSHIKVFDNHIINSYCSGIALAYDSDSTFNTGVIKQVDIYNNIINGSCLGGLDKCAGILFDNRSFRTNIDRFVDIRIKDNYILNRDKYVIWLDKGAKGLRFQRNTFKNYQSGYLFNLQCEAALPCSSMGIVLYKNNSPFTLQEGNRLKKHMKQKGGINNYCLDCDNGKGCYVKLKNGALKCR